MKDSDILLESVMFEDDEDVLNPTLESEELAKKYVSDPSFMIVNEDYVKALEIKKKSRIVEKSQTVKMDSKINKIL